VAFAFPQHSELDTVVTGLGAHVRNLGKPPVDAVAVFEHGSRQPALHVKSLHGVHFNAAAVATVVCQVIPGLLYARHDPQAARRSDADHVESGTKRTLAR
jgi:hypothetical protein